MYETIGTAPLRGAGDGARLPAAPLGGVGLQVDGVGGAGLQLLDVVAEGVFTDGLLQLSTVGL